MFCNFRFELRFGIFLFFLKQIVLKSWYFTIHHGSWLHLGWCIAILSTGLMQISPRFLCRPTAFFLLFFLLEPCAPHLQQVEQKAVRRQRNLGLDADRQIVCNFVWRGWRRRNTRLCNAFVRRNGIHSPGIKSQSAARWTRRNTYSRRCPSICIHEQLKRQEMGIVYSTQLLWAYQVKIKI